MLRPAITRGPESRAIALLAANASVEASVTAFEVAAQLLADDVAMPRPQVQTRAARPKVSAQGVARDVMALRALR